MPKRDRAPPAPEVINALAALNQLRVEQPDADFSDLAKALPPLARKLALNDLDVSVDALLEHARKGSVHVQTQYAALEGFQKNKSQKSYAEIVAVLNPDDSVKSIHLHSRLEAINKRQKESPLVYELRYVLPANSSHCVTGGVYDDLYLSSLARRAAEEYGDAYTLSQLIEKGLSKDRYDELLVGAALHNHSDVMRVLLDNGANPDVISAHSANSAQSLLGHCVALGLQTSALILAEYGAKVTSTELNQAVRYHYPNIASSLEEKGADLSGLSDDNKMIVERYKAWTSAFPEFSPEKLNLPEDVELSSCFATLDFNAKTARDIVMVAFMLGHEDHLVGMVPLAANAVRLFGTEDRVLRYLEQWGQSGKKPLHDILHIITFPPEGEVLPGVLMDLKAWGDAVLQQGPEMAKLVKFSNRLGQPCRSDDDSCWSLTKTRNVIAELTYWRGREHPELAAMARQVRWSEPNFNDALETVLLYQEQYAANDNQKPGGAIPAITIQGAAFNKDGYTFLRLPDGDIRGLALGDFTACCQHIGGFGDEYTKHGFLSPQAGFYAITDNKTDQIVAQSWAWRGTKGELVLDSLEYLSGHVTSEQARTLCHIFVQEARKAGITQAIHIGCGGNTPDMGFKEARQPATPVDLVSHNDSTRQYVIAGPQ